MTPALAVLVAAVLEVAVGEPPERVHPVALLGRVLAPLDREWSRPSLVGPTVAALAPTGAALLVAVPVWTATAVDARVGAAAAGVVLFLVTSLRMLLAEARGAVVLSDADPGRAREALPSLVGRDPTDLTPGQVRSAAVESAAENLSDGLVGPLAAFVVAAAVARPSGAAPALALGAGAATWVKAVNTLDSMLGYRSKPVGRASARLDDAVMWIPARASAVLLALASGRPRALTTAATWQDRVASPNAGWPMGAIAAAADVRLAKPGAYVLNEDADFPTVDRATAAVRTVGLAGVVAYVVAGSSLVAGEVVLWS